MKINFFKILGIIGCITTELGIAMADGKITVAEAAHIGIKICERLGVDVVYDFEEDGPVRLI